MQRQYLRACGRYRCSSTSGSSSVSSKRGHGRATWTDTSGPIVAEQGWVAITRDAKISRRPWEAQTLSAHGAEHVTIAGSEGTSVWAQLEILMRNWRAIDRLWEVPGPYMYTATRSRLTRFPTS